MTIKIIKNGRVTEKASINMEQNVYTFDVAKSANKTTIKQAIFALYKIKPLKVNIVSVPYKKLSTRGKEGMKGGGKKALVFLKKDDKIEII